MLAALFFVRQANWSKYSKKGGSQATTNHPSLEFHIPNENMHEPRHRDNSTLPTSHFRRLLDSTCNRHKHIAVGRERNWSTRAALLTLHRFVPILLFVCLIVHDTFGGTYLARCTYFQPAIPTTTALFECSADRLPTLHHRYVLPARPFACVYSKFSLQLLRSPGSTASTRHATMVLYHTTVLYASPPMPRGSAMSLW